ncbi:MAG: archaeosortase/exosortase family protein [Phycisphaerales bacterium]
MSRPDGPTDAQTMPRPVVVRADAAPARRFAGAARTVVAKRPIVRFVVLTVLLIIAFWGVMSIPFVRLTAHPWLIDRIAESSAWMLRRLGEDASSLHEHVRTSRFTLSIKRGCDAIDPIALFSAAALAFPVRWRSRLIGVAVGAGVLFCLNYARIISLYYVGVHAPGSFETVHIDVWQPVFVFAAVGLWIAWAWRATASRPGPRTAAAGHAGAL